MGEWFVDDVGCGVVFLWACCGVVVLLGGLFVGGRTEQAGRACSSAPSRTLLPHPRPPTPPAPGTLPCPPTPTRPPLSLPLTAGAVKSVCYLSNMHAVIGTSDNFKLASRRCYEVKCRGIQAISADGSVNLDRTDACTDTGKSIIIKIVSGVSQEACLSTCPTAAITCVREL